MKFKAKAKDCQLLVKAKTSIGESIDEKELDRFSRVYLRGFLKPKMVKRNLIEYTGPVGISLYERLKKPTTKREFLFILGCNYGCDDVCFTDCVYSCSLSKVEYNGLFPFCFHVFVFIWDALHVEWNQLHLYKTQNKC